MNWSVYPNYRESTLPWLGQIPSSWEIEKFRYCFSESSEKNGTSPVGEMLSVSGYRGVEIKKYDDENQRRLIDQIEGYRIVRVGQLAVNTMWLNYSGLGVSQFEGYVSPAYRSYWISGKFNGRYIHHLMRSSSYVDGYTALLTGVRPNSLQMSKDDLMAFPILRPSLDEQKKIAEFLDFETAKIDELINKQEQLIATLREDRTATITNAITKGLDPNVEFDNSGSSEIPSCPKHWTRRTQLKRMATVQTGLTLGKVVDPDDSISMPYLRVANVQSWGVKLDEVKTVQVSRSEVPNYLLRDGDVLMTEGGDIDKLGRGCLWSGEVSPCIHQNHVFATRCHAGLNNSFLVYLLDTSVARNYFFMTAKKTTNLASTNSTTLGRFTFSLPPRAEQEEIVKFLDRQTEKIDALTTKASDVIDTLREYRSALITAAVTGKIDVRGAA